MPNLIFDEHRLIDEDIVIHDEFFLKKVTLGANKVIGGGYWSIPPISMITLSWNIEAYEPLDSSRYFHIGEEYTTQCSFCH